MPRGAGGGTLLTARTMPVAAGKSPSTSVRQPIWLTLPRRLFAELKPAGLLAAWEGMLPHAADAAAVAVPQGVAGPGKGGALCDAVKATGRAERDDESCHHKE